MDYHILTVLENLQINMFIEIYILNIFILGYLVLQQFFNVTQLSQHQ